jgi:hypothetical protein
MTRGRSARAIYALAFLGSCALFALFFSPVVATHRYVGDAVDQLLETLPAYLGAHPLWEPQTMLGYPLGADPNQAYFYPLALLRAIPGSFDWYEAAAYALAAFGTFGLVRASTRSTLGAIVGALVFSLGGFMIGQAGHLSIVAPAAWVPYLFWGLTELRDPDRAARAGLAIASVLALAILAGQPQPVVYALFFALPYAAIVARHAGDGVRAYALRASVALALGVGCAGIALVPETELFRASARSSFGFQRFQEFTVPVLQQPLRLFFPYALGFSALAPYGKSAIDVGSFAEMSDYAGISGIVLAIVAIRNARREPFATYWIVAVCVALVLATGNQLGIGWVTYRIPFYDLFRAPGRIANETDLAIAVLAGFGIAAVESGRLRVSETGRACGIVAIAMALAYALFVVVSVVSPELQTLLISGRAKLEPRIFANAALWIPALTLALVAVAGNVWARAPRASWRRALLASVVLADMLGFAAFAYWRSGAFSPRALLPPSYVSMLRSGLAPRAQRLLTVPLPGVDAAGVGPNLNLLWNVASLRGYTPLQLARTRAFYDSDWDAPFRPLALATDLTLDLASVRYVIVVERADAPVDEALVDPVGAFMHEGLRWHFVEQIGSDSILENERALPRAWIVHRTLPAHGVDVIDALRHGAFDPRRTAYVEAPVPPLAASLASASGSDDAMVTSLESSRMRVRVRCATACFLVTSDTTYPGWVASVDATPTPIYPTDEALRGIAVPSGAHDIVFRYDPRTFEIGRAVSAACVAAALVAAFAYALGRRRATSARRPARRISAI